MNKLEPGEGSEYLFRIPPEFEEFFAFELPEEEPQALSETELAAEEAERRKAMVAKALRDLRIVGFLSPERSIHQGR